MGKKFNPLTDMLLNKQQLEDVRKFGDTQFDQYALDQIPSDRVNYKFSELAEDWQFFNHGAFFAFAGFLDPDRDPLADWFVQQGDPHIEIIRQPFDRPIFDGINADAAEGGGLTWNNILCAVRKEYWQSLLEHLGAIATIDSPARKYFQAFAASVKVPDPVVVERKGILGLGLEPPLIEVVVFCVDGNYDRWELREAKTPLGQPRMVRTNPRPDVIERGRNILAGDLSELTQHESPAMKPHVDEFKRVMREGPEIILPDDNES